MNLVVGGYTYVNIPMILHIFLCVVDRTALFSENCYQQKKEVSMVIYETILI